MMDQNALNRLAVVVSWVALLLAAALGVAPLVPPAPPAEQDAAAFSVNRAFDHLERIAQEPRPIGSAANKRARAYIVAQLESLGLEPEVQIVEGTDYYGGSAARIEIVNVVARIPGTVPTRAVALVGHYDTVPSTPGANDDASAVAWVNRVTGEPRALPVPAEQVLPAHDLRRPQGPVPAGYVAVQTARGCPYRCPYCAVGQLAPPGFHPRAPERVADEIAWCVESLEVRDVAFYDDALLFDAGRHLLPILDRVQSRGLRVRFHTPNGLHARFIDPALAFRLREAGFVTLRLGLESADPGQQQRDGDKVDRDRFARAVEALWAAGFTAREVRAYVLIGRPGQDVASVRATVAYAHALGVPVSTAQFSPIPGTREWEAAVAAGHMETAAADASAADPLLHNNSLYPCAEAEQWEALKVQVRRGNQRVGAP